MSGYILTELLFLEEDTLAFFTSVLSFGSSFFMPAANEADDCVSMHRAIQAQIIDWVIFSFMSMGG
jgi:esterase/lipase superfamily enzyme